MGISEREMVLEAMVRGRSGMYWVRVAAENLMGLEDMDGGASLWAVGVVLAGGSGLDGLELILSYRIVSAKRLALCLGSTLSKHYLRGHLRKDLRSIDC